MIKVEIDRAKWDRGEGSEGSLLVSPDSPTKAGCRCALGFVALACGISDTDICEVGDPSDFIEREDHGWPDSLIEVETITDEEDGEDVLHAALTDVATMIMHANDDPKSYETDAAREAKIIELGVKAGIEFVFTGEGKP